MLGEAKIRQITKQVLALSTADQTEVIFLGQDSEATRFANSYIHQNVAESNAELSVRVVVGKKIGVASINDLGAEALQKVVETAQEAARFQPENPDFVSLPEPQPISALDAFVEATATFTPQDRAKAVEVICRQAVENGLIASGVFTTASEEIAVANSLGVFAYHPTTSAHLKAVIMSDDSSGYAADTSLDVTAINPEAIGVEAVGKALRGKAPRDIEPGEYDVILEEYATIDLLETLSYPGFGALAVQEERSFMCHRFGERIMSEKVSIWDDGLDLDGLPVPFDFEGVPKQRVDLIERGVAKAVVYDSYTAGKEGKASTGHALPAPNTFGPIPLNWFMAVGEATKEEMVASVKRGVWVTRFWYTRAVHPKLALITGMTRDGTFWIEDGEIAYPVKNLRFTQSYVEALANVEMVGKTTKLEPGISFGIGRVPALKISRFNFTGASP